MNINAEGQTQRYDSTRKTSCLKFNGNSSCAFVVPLRRLIAQLRCKLASNALLTSALYWVDALAKIDFAQFRPGHNFNWQLCIDLPWQREYTTW